jgi:hypothetical protein
MVQALPFKISSVETGLHPEPVGVTGYDHQDHSGRERSEDRTVGYQGRVLIDDRDAKS